jgi:aquaporin Z
MASLAKRLVVESAGTAWLVFIGCGSAVLNAGVLERGGNVLVVSLAFGAALATATFVLGRISGAHFNPAVTVGFAAANRFPVRELVPYIAAQTVGAVAGAALLVCIASGRPGFELAGSEFGANGFGDHSPWDYRLHSALVIELVMSFALVIAYLLMPRSPGSRFSTPLAKGACMSLVYMVALPVTNASVNPARSTGPAVFVGDWALDQLWLFWAAPLAGGIIAGIAYSLMRGGAHRQDAKRVKPAAHSVTTR